MRFIGLRASVPFVRRLSLCGLAAFLAAGAALAAPRPLLISTFCKNVGGYDFDRTRILERFQSLGYEIQEVPCERESLLAIQFPANRPGVFFYTGHGSAEEAGLFGNKKKFVFNTQGADVYAAELVAKIPRTFMIWIDACFSGAAAKEFPQHLLMHAASDASAAFGSPKFGAAMTTWVHEVLLSSRSDKMDLDRDGQVSLGEFAREVSGDANFFTASFQANRKYLGLQRSGAGLSVPDSIDSALAGLPLAPADPNGPAPGRLFSPSR